MVPKLGWHPHLPLVLTVSFLSLFWSSGLQVTTFSSFSSLLSVIFLFCMLRAMTGPYTWFTGEKEAFPCQVLLARQSPPPHTHRKKQKLIVLMFSFVFFLYMSLHVDLGGGCVIPSLVSYQTHFSSLKYGGIHPSFCLQKFSVWYFHILWYLDRPLCVHWTSRKQLGTNLGVKYLSTFS